MMKTPQKQHQKNRALEKRREPMESEAAGTDRPQYPAGGTLIPSTLPGLWFTMYPATISPTEKLVAYCYGGGWRAPGVFRAGEWTTMTGKPMKRQVHHYIVLDHKDASE